MVFGAAAACGGGYIPIMALRVHQASSPLYIMQTNERIRPSVRSAAIGLLQRSSPLLACRAVAIHPSDSITNPGRGILWGSLTNRPGLCGIEFGWDAPP